MIPQLTIRNHPQAPTVAGTLPNVNKNKHAILDVMVPVESSDHRLQ